MGTKIGISLKQGRQKFWTFKPLESDESNFRNGVDIKNKLNLQ